MISQGFLGNLGSIKSTPQSYVQAYFETWSGKVLPENEHERASENELRKKLSAW